MRAMTPEFGLSCSIGLRVNQMVYQVMIHSNPNLKFLYEPWCTNLLFSKIKNDHVSNVTSGRRSYTLTIEH